jgi:hypothetical protein
MALSHFDKLPAHIAQRAKKYKLPRFYEDRWRRDLIGALDTLILLPTNEGPEYWQAVKEKCEDGSMLDLDPVEAMILVDLINWPYKTFSYSLLQKRWGGSITREELKPKVDRLRALGRIKFNGKKYEVIDG